MDLIALSHPRARHLVAPHPLPALVSPQEVPWI